MSDQPIAYMRNEGTPNNLVKCTFLCEGAFGVYRHELSKLTALREELAASRKNTEFAQESMQAFADEVDRVQQRLADAERRNSEMMSMINEAFERLVCITPRNKPSGALKQQAMDILQGAAIKPIESGASGLDPKIIGIERMPPMEYDEP